MCRFVVQVCCAGLFLQVCCGHFFLCGGYKRLEMVWWYGDMINKFHFVCYKVLGKTDSLTNSF